MKLTILGCGTAALNLNKHEAGYLLEHNKKLYLFDSGAGTVYQLLKLGTRVKELDFLLYTHFHTDHINDLPAILWSCEYDGDPRIKKLVICGPTGLRKYFSILKNDIMRKDEFNYLIEVNEVTNKEFAIGDLNVKTKELNHFGNIAYRVSAGMKTFVYSGDLSYCREIEDIAKGADVLIVECGIVEKGKGHMTPEEAGIVANNAKVSKLILTHCYPIVDTVDAIKLAKKHFKGKIVLAKDFMEVKI